MTFINEYISDEDMEKYKIVDLYKEFNPSWNHLNEINMKGYYSWTIDKERNTFFIPVWSGRCEESNIKRCVLWWDGLLLSVKIAKIGGWVNHIEEKGAVVWDLIGIWRPNGCTISDEAIKSILKEALVVYELDGALSEMKQYDVSFKF